MFGSLAISHRSPQSRPEITFQSTPCAQPTISGPVPPAPTWMSPEMTPFVTAAPDERTSQENVVSGNCRSSVFWTFRTISGA